MGGRKEISFSDGTLKVIKADGEEVRSIYYNKGRRGGGAFYCIQYTALLSHHYLDIITTQFNTLSGTN